MYQIDWGIKGYLASRYLNLWQGKNYRLAIATFLSAQISAVAMMPLLSFAEPQSQQPVQEDIPEEVLRAEIYTDARSPIDGKQLSAAEYTELMEKLRSLDGIPPEDLVSPKVREVIGLLKLRKFLKQFIPFIP
ncbi:MAG: hypothetical protein ACKO7R_09160 [Pseudanabaena sp.]